MSKKKITADLISRLRQSPPATVTDYYDTKYPYLVLRARPSGVHTYRVTLGRAKWYTLGTVQDITVPDRARDLAEARRGEVKNGRDPQAEKQAARQAEAQRRPLGVYLDTVYEPWRQGEKPHSENAEICQAIRAAFPTLLPLPLDAVTPAHIATWRTARLKTVTVGTVNRNVSYLLTLYRRALKAGDLPVNPLAAVTLLDEAPGEGQVVRYLSDDEEARLRAALAARDAARRAERARGNAWRRQRDYDTWEPHAVYTDYVTPFVLTLLATGLRFGELTALRWRHLDLGRGDLHVVAQERGARKAGLGRGRHLQLHSEIVTVLKAWRPTFGAPTPDAYVFPSPKRRGQRLTESKTVWKHLMVAATIDAFRIHDLRHTFASNLVMSGVDLYTVQQLLGHASSKMTQIYAHLAPEHKAAAVEKLVRVK